jgi:hypothetical protein
MAPLWNSSDPAACDLEVQAGDVPGEVRVHFHRPGETAWTELTFVLTATRDTWRIRDIRYPGGDSLIRRLTSPSAPDTSAQGTAN